MTDSDDTLPEEPPKQPDAEPVAGPEADLPALPPSEPPRPAGKDAPRDSARALIARFGAKMAGTLLDTVAPLAPQPPKDPLTALEDEIETLIALLSEESEAAERGQLDIVAATTAAKTDQLARVEHMLAAFPDLEPCLTERPSLREALERLRDIAARNARVLSVAAEAARVISTEIQRIKDRHTKAGLYGRDGQSRDRPEVPGADHIDKEL